MSTTNSPFDEELEVSDSMTKRQAFEAMQSGKKVCHRTFIEGEYLSMHSGNVITEEGFTVCKEEGFFLYQKGVIYQTGWYEYK